MQREAQSKIEIEVKWALLVDIVGLGVVVDVVAHTRFGIERQAAH